MSARSMASPLRSTTPHFSPRPRTADRAGSRAPAGKESGSPLASTSTVSGLAFGCGLQLGLVGPDAPEGVGVDDVSHGKIGTWFAEAPRGRLPAGRPHPELFAEQADKD